MIHDYRHTFADGEILHLRVTFANDSLHFEAWPRILSPQHNAEYLVWRNQHVVPDVVARLNPEQLEAMAAVGCGIS